MLLASLALTVQVAANPPGRTEVARPCADPSLLCRISPFFCPGTYPVGLEPCWPEAPHETRTLSSRPGGSEGSLRRGRGNAAATPAAAPVRPPAKAREPGLSPE